MLIAACVLAACAPETTQIVLVVDTDLAIPTPLVRIDIEVASSRTAATRFDLPLDAASTPPLPLTVSLYPNGSADVDVFVSVRGLDASGTTLVSRDVRTRFVPGSSRMLRVLLADRCLGVRCAGDETCDETGCRAIAIAGDVLPSWPGSPPALDGPACEPSAEGCNGFDDDCDGTVDEGITLASDPANCGRCGHVCEGSACMDGFCGGERPVQIAAGGAHTCVRRESGALACWGWNLERQAGEGDSVALSMASDVAGVSEATDVSLGGAHTCAISSGGVACFGNGSAGELGDGMSTDSIAPVSAMGLAGALQVSAGAAHVCAVTEDGRVFCWGRNEAGQLGDGTTSARATPTWVTGVSDARGVAAGLRHTCAVLTSGAVMCWGANDDGQLGTGLPERSLVPVDVVGLSDAIAIGVGRRHTCAIRTGGAVACWGANESGQLGDGTTNRASVPVGVVGIADASELAVALAGTHACVLRAGGVVTCWGSNLAGQLGDGTAETRVTPVDALVSDAIGVATGGHSDDGTGHSCAIAASGAVACWGEGTLGRLGNGARIDSPMPVAVLGLP